MGAGETCAGSFPVEGGLDAAHAASAAAQAAAARAGSLEHDAAMRVSHCIQPGRLGRSQPMLELGDLGGRIGGN